MITNTVPKDVCIVQNADNKIASGLIIKVVGEQRQKIWRTDRNVRVHQVVTNLHLFVLLEYRLHKNEILIY